MIEIATPEMIETILKYRYFPGMYVRSVYGDYGFNRPDGCGAGRAGQ